MAKSLRISSLLRLLKSGDTKTIGHVWYWIGECLKDLLPNAPIGLHAKHVPVYYDSLALLITDASVNDVITSVNWSGVTNKVVYTSFVQSFAKTKIETDLGFSLKHIWRKLYAANLPSKTNEVMYLFIHNKLPLNERLFRIHLSADPYCSSCLDNIGIAEIANREHCFCGCGELTRVWGAVKEVLLKLLTSKATSIPGDMDFLTLNFTQKRNEKEIVWLVSTYVSELWRQMKLGSAPSKDQMFGFLRFKYKADRMGSRLPLGLIPDL